MDIYSIVVIGLCALFVLIADRIWSKYGKDDGIVETVEFYPPESYNSAEIGFLYKGYADKKDVISLLVYLASKGYLKIDNMEKDGLLSKSKSFKITKLKDYDGHNEYEKVFFDGLFGCAKGTLIKTSDLMKKNKKLSWKEAKEIIEANDDGKVSVTPYDLYDSFYRIINSIQSKLNSRENKRKIFESFTKGKIKWLILMIITILTLITLKPILEYSSALDLIFAIISPIVGFGILLVSFMRVFEIPKLVGLINGLSFGVIPLIFIVFPALSQNLMYIVTYIIGAVNIIVLLLFAMAMPRRTNFGKEILGKIRGFKRFLETAEKPQLDALLNKDPKYFYNVLPYIYVLGISDEWINQFEKIALQSIKSYEDSWNNS